jgi:release factor glutamine methyltransferase
MPEAADTQDLAGASVHEAIRVLAGQLSQAGVEDPARDARVLVANAIGGTLSDIVRAPERVLGEAEARRLVDGAQRRAGREPVSRILGRREFYGRDFLVGPATLDPRPCTETLVDAVLELADREGWRSRPIRILDAGTGSGCILLSLLAELQLAHGVGTDINAEALAIATENARRLGVAERTEFRQGRYFDAAQGEFDVVVSNPPYIPTGDIEGLEPEVRDHEPRAALDGGPDGLDAYREIAAGLNGVLRRGWIVVEVGADQADDVARILAKDRAIGPLEHLVWEDLGGHRRCVALWTQS